MKGGVTMWRLLSWAQPMPRMIHDIVLFLHTKIWGGIYIRADSRFAPSQWETLLLYNDVSHWLVVSLESALYKYVSVKSTIFGAGNDLFLVYLVWNHSQINEDFLSQLRLKNNLQLTKMQPSFKQNTFEGVMCKIVAILFRPKCVNSLRPCEAYLCICHWCR